MVRLLKAISVLFLLCLTYGCWANNEQSHDVPMTFSNSEMSTHQQTLTVGLGCFWGAEKRFSQLDGVINVVSGYADGRGIAPTYQAIIQRENKFNPNNFAEVVQITFNALQISTEQLLKRFFEWHDPTQGNRQGNDIGTQYRSTILYVDEAQQRVADKVKAEFQTKLSDAGFGVITTTIKPLDEFHPAESYHQDYLVKNPNGYCPDHSTGVRFDAAPHNDTAAPSNLALLKGKHIIVIDSEFCPYCEKLKKDVLNDYTGTIPVHFRQASELDNLSINSETWATPTLLFMQDGNEQFGIQGYVNRLDFYKALGYFKLGKTEAFNVAFNEGTDGRFCKQYDLFKNTPDGQFVDKVSGAPLFDTDYRFNSGTGWLSFTQPIEGSVYYKEDNRYGMQRTEVRAKKSDIHLGHVFNDGPDGKPRYCINATVLEFVPRA